MLNNANEMSQTGRAGAGRQLLLFLLCLAFVLFIVVFHIICLFCFFVSWVPVDVPVCACCSFVVFDLVGGFLGIFGKPDLCNLNTFLLYNLLL